MNNIGNTGIIPFTYFGGVQKSVGSTFLRVDCLVAGNPGFEKWIHGKKYDNLIFQKAYWKEMMELFDGPKILDLCDPDWLRECIDIIEIGKLIHAITCSSEGLTCLIKNYFPDKMVVHVPDRLNPAVFPTGRHIHEGHAKNVVWFGFIHNAHETLVQLLPAIKEFHLNLRIISDRPYSKEDGISELNPEFICYDQRTAYDLIKEADIVLNPKSEKAFYKYKSNNKTLIGWKLGLPVAITNDDLSRFIDPAERNAEVIEKQKLVEQEFLISKSAAQYREIIVNIRKQYFSPVKGSRLLHSI
jgi:hypothetical protein